MANKKKYNYIDFDLANIVMLVVQFCATYFFAVDKLGKFNPAIRFDVYHQLNYNIQKAQPLRLNVSANGQAQQLMELIKQKNTIIDIVEYQQYIYTVTLINIVLMMVRMLKILDFQPRIALVTKTIEAAASDLFHFSILFIALHTGFSLCGLILFGVYAEDFTTFANAAVTLFSILIGNSDIDSRMTVTEVSNLWTSFYFVYLLISYFVLFNIFLAIIIDGYVNISSQTGEAPTIAQELTCMVDNLLRFVQNPQAYQSDEAIINILEDALENKGIKEKEETPIGAHRLCGGCCAKTRKKATKEIKNAVSKISPMHLQRSMSTVLDHEASSNIRLSKYLDVEDRFVHFNANRAFLRQLLQEIGVAKQNIKPVANAIFDKLPHFKNDNALEDEGQDLQNTMAIRALYNTALETKRNIADAAIKKHQQKIVGVRNKGNLDGLNNRKNAKDAWGV
jgi:hypothetical protein